MNRREAREIVFMIIFEKMFNKDSVDSIIKNAEDIRDFKADDFTLSVIKGIYENIDFIDNIISRNLTNWSLDRISKVSLALLRLATYEIFFRDDISEKISINEMLEISKIYNTPEDTLFLNGVIRGVVGSKGES